MSNTSIDDFADNLIDIMQVYVKDVSVDMKEDIDAVAKETVKRIKANAPVRAGNKDRSYSSSRKSYAPGTYKKSWTSSVQSEKSYSKTRVVHSKGQYMLTHLLEKGHASRFGGRVKAIEHIAPVEEYAVKELEERLKRRIRS